MTYIAEKPTVQSSERQLITIEFAPPQDPNESEYSIPQPLFIFTEQVIQRNNPFNPFKICAMELVESTTSSGQLLNQPYWKYKLTNGQEQIWKDESALDRYSPTCAQCPHFNDYQESNGRGWCHLFNRQARANHQQTNDCIVSSDLETFPTKEIEDEADLPYSEYQVGSIVKVIDQDDDHREWAVFEIVECKYNHSLFDNTKSYLNQAQWYFRLASLQDSNTLNKSLWVAENEICHFEQSHLISTQDIF
jgi:hypothetical protein